MADLAGTDITYTQLSAEEGNKNGRVRVFTLAFGDGALTYPAGGVPVTKASLGCPNNIDSLIVFDKGTSGYEWSYDRTNLKLVALQAPVQTHSHSLSLKNAAVADGATTRVNAGTNLLGANTGSDITVAGGGANGGVASATLAAAVLTQPSTIAIAAQVLKVRVVGY